MSIESSQTYNLNILFGTVEAKTFHKFENGRMVSYCYSIKRDRDGREISRTEPVAMSSVGYDDGTPFSEDEYKRLMDGNPPVRRKTGRLFGIIKGLSSAKLSRKGSNG